MKKGIQDNTKNNSNKENTAELVYALQKGDSNAAVAIYNTFYNDIFFFILKNVRDPQLASDLTEDTFTEINRTIGNLRIPNAFVPWSKRIAYLRYTEHLKKRKDILADESGNGHALIISHAWDENEFIPDGTVDQQELKSTICNILDKLPEEIRSTILLRYYDEISIKDIAKIQNTTEKTVKERLNHGRTAIKQSVELYEKKHDTKLNYTGIIPVLIWFFREDRLAKGISLTEITPAVKEALANLLKTLPKRIARRIIIRGLTALMILCFTTLLAYINSEKSASDINKTEISNIAENTSSVETIITSESNESIENNSETYNSEDNNSETNNSEADNSESTESTTTGTDSNKTESTEPTTEDTESPEITPPKTESESEESTPPENDPQESLPKVSEGLEYVLSDDATYYTVSGIGTCTDTHVIIPSEYNKLPVGAIGISAFDGCDFTTVTLPNSIKSIGTCAFVRCSNLTNITLSDNITYIGNDVFQFCDELTELTIPASVTCIDGSIFDGCNKLKTLVVEEGNSVYHSSGNCIIETASKTLISGCSTSTIPSDGSVTIIQRWTFIDLSTLTSMVIPNGVTYLGSQAFDYCENLFEVTLPDTIMYMGNMLFYNCSSLTDIYYAGTMEQWNSIDKISNWAPSHGRFTIHCSDGDITP